jgi:hypothetical protein
MKVIGTMRTMAIITTMVITITTKLGYLQNDRPGNFAGPVVLQKVLISV